MARGWESKSIEAHQEEVAEDRAKAREGAQLTADQAVKSRDKGVLELARASIMQQLAACSNPRRAEMLERALADLNHKLEKFD